MHSSYSFTDKELLSANFISATNLFADLKTDNTALKISSIPIRGITAVPS